MLSLIRDVDILESLLDLYLYQYIIDIFKYIYILAHHVLSESQCGFRPNRGTADMIFAARQLQEKCRERNKDLYTVFVDLSKAFDTVNRDGLWAVLRRFGC